MSAPLVVYDTMVFLQAAIQPHRRYLTIEAVEDKRLILCMSDPLLEEIQDVLTRSSMVAKFPALTGQRVGRLMNQITALSRRFAAVPKKFNWPQHPDDDHLFDLAIESRASYLVTWEKRLLGLSSQSTDASKLLRKLAPGLIVCTPKQLAERFKS